MPSGERFQTKVCQALVTLSKEAGFILFLAIRFRISIDVPYFFSFHIKIRKGGRNLGVIFRILKTEQACESVFREG